jgi:hypothetical protein
MDAAMPAAGPDFEKGDYDLIMDCGFVRQFGGLFGCL